MPEPAPPVVHPRDLPLDVVREMARDRAERTSIRHVAGEMGMGSSTLHNFLRGTEPHPRVRRVLAEWYSREISKGGTEYHESTYTSALQVLLAALPAEVRPAATQDVLGAIERLHLKSGTPLPWWLRQRRAVGETTWEE